MYSFLLIINNILLFISIISNIASICLYIFIYMSLSWLKCVQNCDSVMIFFRTNFKNATIPSKCILGCRINVINFQALLPHMYGDINKLFQCFVELMFFYFLFAHNIYSKLQHCFSISKHLHCRALQDNSEFNQYKPKCLNTAQVVCPQHLSRMREP